eukprot:2051686-Lingulodinium_polyedra.AAC.1
MEDEEEDDDEAWAHLRDLPGSQSLEDLTDQQLLVQLQDMIPPGARAEVRRRITGKSPPSGVPLTPEPSFPAAQPH